MTHIVRLGMSVVVDDGGRIRGPRRLWALSRGWWLRPDDDGDPRDRERRAREALAAFDEAGAARSWARPTRIGWIRALRDLGRTDEAALAARSLTVDPADPALGAAWIAAALIHGWRLPQAEQAADGIPAEHPVAVWLRARIALARGQALAPAEPADGAVATAALHLVHAEAHATAGAIGPALAAIDRAAAIVVGPDPERISRLLGAIVAGGDRTIPVARLFDPVDAAAPEATPVRPPSARIAAGLLLAERLVRDDQPALAASVARAALATLD
ncbi:MAG: hypothetical protein ABMB14_39215, partial [Myxococcota bacterium]